MHLEVKPCYDGGMRLSVALLLAALSCGCSIAQPGWSKAPVADVVGASAFSVAATAFVPGAYSASTSDHRGDAAQGALALGSIAFVYVISAIYGFEQAHAAKCHHDVKCEDDDRCVY